MQQAMERTPAWSRLAGVLVARHIMRGSANCSGRPYLKASIPYSTVACRNANVALPATRGVLSLSVATASDSLLAAGCICSALSGHAASEVASQAAPAEACSDPAAARVSVFVRQCKLFAARRNNVSHATPVMPFYGLHASPYNLNYRLPRPVLSQQRLRETLLCFHTCFSLMGDNDDHQRPHRGNWHHQSSSELQNAEAPPDPQHEYDDARKRPYYVIRSRSGVFEKHCARKREELISVPKRWWRHGKCFSPYTPVLPGPLLRVQYHVKRCQGSRQQHDTPLHISDKSRQLINAKHSGDQLPRQEAHLHWQSLQNSLVVRPACSSSTSATAQCICWPNIHLSPVDLLGSRSSDTRAYAAGPAFLRRFSTSTERVSHELEQRLLSQADDPCGSYPTEYDRRKQGVVLAVAGDVLLARGLAAAPIGTLVCFTQGGPRRASASNTTDASGVMQDAIARTPVAAAATSAAGKLAADRLIADLPEAVDGTGKLRDDGEQAPVLGVVLQLLQHDLNILGILGGSSNFYSPTGECVPFRVPCTGDICTAVSAYGKQQAQWQRHPARGMVPHSQLQDAAEQQRHVPQEDQQPQCERHQPEGSQSEKPYQLLDSFLPASSARVISPMALLQRVVPATIAANGAMEQYSEPERFFNVLDLPSSNMSGIPCGTESVTFPWGLPTGSAAVDALAPLQLGETSAFIGPPGTGKTQALVPAVALHAAAAGVASAAADSAEAAPERAGRLLPNGGVDTAPHTIGTRSKAKLRPQLSVVFLTFESSPSNLRRWLESVSEEARVYSDAVSGESGDVAECKKPPVGVSHKHTPATEAKAYTEMCSRSCTTSRIQIGTDAFSARPTSATAADTPREGISVPPTTSCIGSLAVLHVPGVRAGMPGAAAGSATEKVRGGCRVLPTSTLAYLAPVLALRLALEAQAAAAVHERPYPVLLVIDGLAMHPSSVERLQMDIQKLLTSQSAAVHLPAGIAGVPCPDSTVPLPPGAAAGYTAAAAAAVALPFSATTVYGLLSCRASRVLVPGTGGPLSLLLVLDTASEPALLTARNLQRGGSSAMHQTPHRFIEHTLLQTLKEGASVSGVCSRKSAREAEDALLSTAQRTILFTLDMHQQQYRQLQSLAQAAHVTVQREQQQQRQQQVKHRTGTRTKDLLLPHIYPMVDIDSVVATSTAAVSADASAALALSCFSRRDIPTEEEDRASQEALWDALRALSRRQLRAEKQRSGWPTPCSTTISRGAHRMAEAANENYEMEKTITRRGQLRFEPPALLAAAGAAFAWQRRILHNESERHQLMQQFRLFVDEWEEEDVDSLRIASAVCLARPTGCIFGPAEQVVLLRAAATFFFNRSRAPSAAAGEGERQTHILRGYPAAGSASCATGLETIAALAGPRRNNFFSFAQICAFQDDLLRMFQEKEPRLWDALRQHLTRAGEWPLQLLQGTQVRSVIGGRKATGGQATPKNGAQTNLIEGGNVERWRAGTNVEEEKQVDSLAQDVMHLIRWIDTVLLDMRSYFDFTAPCAPQE